MKTKIEPTKTVFRIFNKRDGGEVIGIFPRDVGSNDPATCSSYMHTGQHSACRPDLLARSLRLAKPAEYADLKRELENYGPKEAHYVLDVQKRCTCADFKERQRQISEFLPT